MDNIASMLGVRSPDNPGIAAVETRIRDKFSISRGQKFMVGASSNPAGLRAELKAWLMEQGINPRKLERMQDSSLAAAYESDKYLETLRYDYKTKRLDHIGDPKYGWKLRGLNLDDLDNDDDYQSSTIEPKNDLDDDYVPSKSPVVQLFDTPKVEPEPEQKLVSIQDLARAADQVISPRLSAIKAQLERDIEDKISRTPLKLSDDAKASIKALARDSANEVARALIKELLPPRRLEIVDTKTGNVIDLGLQHFKFEVLLRACSARNHEGHRLNVWLTGPTASGKSHAASQVAKCITLDFSYDGSLDNDFKVMGFVNAMGSIVSTAFLERFANGGIYLADEIDQWLPGALVALNAALSNGWCRDPLGKVIKRHKDFVCIAAANTWGQGATSGYVSRLKQDDAALDRFHPKIEWPYDEKLETEIARQMGGDDGIEWAKTVQTYRQKVQIQGLKIVVSPRATISGIALMQQGFTKSEVIDMTFAAGLKPEQKQAIGLVS